MVSLGWGQDEFRSKRSGVWDGMGPMNSVWERWNGSDWVNGAQLPDENSTVTILNGDTITLGSDESIKNLTIEDGGQLNLNGKSLTAENSGTITIDDGGSLIGTSQTVDVDLLIFNSGTYNLIVNDATTGVDIGEMRFKGSVTISGDGIINIWDDFQFESSNITVTNNLTGAITLSNNSNSYIFFTGANSSFLINDGVIICNNPSGGIAFNTISSNTIINNHIFEFYNIAFFNNPGIINNNGIITQHGVITQATEGKIYNYSGATWNYGGATFDSDIKLYCDFDTNTFNYNRSDDQNIIEPQDAYWHLTLSGSDSKISQSDLDINGNLTIESSTTFDIETNGNHVNIAGNWLCEGLLDDDNTANYIEFDGSGNQEFTSGGEVIGNLKINKSGGTLYLLDDVTVDNELTMSDGIIDAKTYGDNTFYLEDNNAASLVYFAGQIIGKVERDVAVADAYLFPVGTASNYNGITVDFNDGPSAGSIIAEFKAEDPGLKNLAVYDASKGDSVYHQFEEGYWSLQGDGISPSNYNISVEANGFTTYPIDSETRLLHREDGGNYTESIPGKHGVNIGDTIVRDTINEAILDVGSTEFALGHPVCVLSITDDPDSVLNQCLGEDVGFKVTATGGSANSYQWQKDGTDVPGETNDTLTVLSIDATDVGDYRCIVSNHCDKDTSAVAYLGLDDEAPTFNSKIEDDTIALLDASCNYLVLDFSHRVTATDNCSAVTISQTPIAGTTISDSTTVTLTITDEYGNSANCNFAVNTLDTILPEITSCAADTLVNLDVNCQYTLPDFTSDADFVYSDCSNTIVTQSPLAGTTISDSTTVTLTITDEYGNSANCIFAVNTIDTIQPTISCPINVIQSNDLGDCSALVGSIAPITNDGCGVIKQTWSFSGATVGNSAASGIYDASDQIFNVGVTTVTYYTADIAGNSNTCNFTVTVTDDEAPTAIAQPTLNLTISIDSGIAVIDTNDIDNGSTDNCSIASRSIDIDTFRCDDIGDTIAVVLTVTDVNGNASTDTTQVTITGYDVEPVVSYSMDSDSMLCSGETLTISMLSNADSTTYGWVFSAHDSIMGWTNDTIIYPVDGKYELNQTIFNTSDTAFRVGISIGSRLFELCDQPQFDTTIYFWVIPSLSAEITPEADTLCNNQLLNLTIGSPNVFDNMRFKYEIVAENPDSLKVHYLDAQNDLMKGHIIADSLVNTSLFAQKAKIIVEPYVSDGGAMTEACPGTKDSIEVWVEPTLAITAINDTLCSEAITNIAVQTNNVATRGIRYTWTVADLSGGTITGYSDSLGIGYPIDKPIEQQLTNTGTDSASVIYTLTPHTIWADSSLHCAGASIDVRVWVNPFPQIEVTASDTAICDSATVNFAIDSVITTGIFGQWDYDVTAVPSNASYISGYNGLQYQKDDHSDRLVNTSDTIQWVDYTFHPKLLNLSYSTDSCTYGTLYDTTIRVLVNPTPRLSVTLVPDTLVCDSSAIDFTIDSILKATTGQWVYDLTATVSNPGLITGVTTGTDLSGNFTDYLDNTSDAVQWVEYTFHPHIINPAGSANCDNGTSWDTTIRVWVEPTPRLTLAPLFDTLCSGDTTTMQISSITSSFYDVEFEYTVVPDNPTEVMINLGGVQTGLPNGFVIEDQLINKSDTAQIINFRVVPYTVDRDGNKQCTGDTVVTEIVLETALNALLTPVLDTVCNEESVSIEISTTSKTAQPIKFYYYIVPENPDTVDIIYDTLVNGTVALDTSMTITDKLVNKSDTAQLVTFYVVPYLDGGSSYSCPTVVGRTEIWVEPSPKINLLPKQDTICSNGFTQIELTSPSGPSYPVRFIYTALPDNPDSVDVNYTGDTTNYLRGQFINDSIVNLSDTAQLVRYIVTAFTVDGLGNVRCQGTKSDTAYIWVEPTPKVELVPEIDTICTNDVTNVQITSVTGATKPVEFSYVIVPDNSGAVGVVYNNATAGLLEGFTIADSLINNTNTAQLVRIIVTPNTVDNSGNLRCSGFNDTSLVWVEPAPKVELVPQLDTICDSEITSIQITSPTDATHPVQFSYVIEPINSGAVNFVLNGANTGLSKNDIIADSLINKTDTAQLVRFIVSPYTVDGFGVQRCSGEKDTALVWVEPTPKVVLVPQVDTICAGDAASIVITSLTGPTNPVQFSYVAEIENPTDVTVTPDSLTGLVKQDIIHPVITNDSDTKQMVRFIVTPYTVDNVNNQKCTGINDTAIVWVEPMAKVLVTPSNDTLCNDKRVSLALSSVSVPTRGVRFRYTVEASEVTVVLGDTTNLSSGFTIADSLHNNSNDAQLVKFIITPYTRESSSDIEKCMGINDTAFIWLEPTPKVNFDHSFDTVCNGLNFDSILIQSVTNPTVEVRFDVDIIPDNPTEVSSTSYSYSNLAKNFKISDLLENLTNDTIQRVVVHVTPYLMDANGLVSCTNGIADSVVIQLTPSLIMFDSVRQYPRYQIQCYGDANGAIYMYPTGGILAFGDTYFDHTDLNYSLNATSGWPEEVYYSDYYVADGLTAGNYAIEATDFSGCVTAPKVDTLTQAESPFVARIKQIVPILCAGVGSAEMCASKYGGAYYLDGSDTIGYTTAIWYNSGSGSDTLEADTIYNVYPGKFEIVVWDTNGCLSTHDTSIFGANAPYKEDLYATDYNGFDISCPGMSDGVLNSRYSPAADTITYHLFEADSVTLIDSIQIRTDQIIKWDSLSAGTYVFKVTSLLGCYTYDTITFVEPDPISITDYTVSEYHNGSWNVVCSDSANGWINLNTIAGGRDANYTFSWSTLGSEFSTDTNISNLGRGDYKIVIDDGYCADSMVIALTSPDSIYIANRIIDNNLCYADSSGRIELEVQGGEGSYYTYNWAHDGINSEVADNLTAGMYSVAIHDSIGCILLDTIELSQPEQLTLASQLSDYKGYQVSCKNGTDGEITITTAGGTGLRNYNWVHNAQLLPNDSSLSDLDEGTYYLTLQDANACEVEDTFNLQAPPAMVITALETEDRICSTLGIGAVTVDGGVKISGTYYTYIWSNGITESSTDSLNDGSQSVVITDWNGCQVDSSFMIEYLSNISIGINVDQEITCFGDADGILSVAANNANLPFTSVKWNDVDSPETIENLGEGTYIVSITDSKACFDSDTILLMQPAEIESDIIPIDPSCFSLTDGSIQLNAIGGNGTYSYSINGVETTGDFVDELAAGEYKIKISDIKNCFGWDTITLIEPEKLELVELTDQRVLPICPDSPNGYMKVVASGGTEDYTYQWSENDFPGSELQGVKEGLYRVSVTDINGCVVEDSIFLQAHLSACLDLPSAITPNGDTYNDFWDIINPLDDKIDLTIVYPDMIIKIFNRWGQLVWESERGYPRDAAWEGTDRNGRVLPVDSYHYIVYLNNGSGTTMRGIVTIVK
jgi:gliding motility-associated-like protein